MKSVRSILITIAMCLPLSLAACGDKDKDKGEKAGDPQPTATAGGDKAAAAPAAKGAPLDCAAFGAKIMECKEPFKVEYAKTEAAARAGGGDGAKGAGNFTDMQHTAERFQATCEKTFGDRGDERWADCMGKADCAEWAACIAPAINDNLHM